jgi:hypothetical protein
MSTLATYLQISNNLTKWQNLTASQPDVKQQTQYYQQNIGKIKTPADLVNNYRLFSYVLNAYGLGDQVYAKSLFQKVLEQGTGSTKTLAYTLNDPRILALAKTFNFKTLGASTTWTTVVKNDVVNNFIEQSLETNQGQSNPGVQLALYFQRNAPNIKTAYNILGDKNLLTVVQTALGISPLTSAMDVDRQATVISNKLNIKDFQDPKKLASFIQKFSVLYDINYAGATTSQTTTVPNALVDLTGNTTGIGVDLLSSIQGLKLGGF